MLIGVVRPVIVLPREVEQERLGDILAHELTHARRHDLLYKWFAVAVTGLHWFNPLMMVVRRQLNRACELSCDAAVVHGPGRRRTAALRGDLAGHGRQPAHQGDGAADRHPVRGEGTFEGAAGVCDAAGEKRSGNRRPYPGAGTGPDGCAAIFGAEPTPSAGPEPSPSVGPEPDPVVTPDPNALLADPVLYDLSNGLTAALPAAPEG